MENDSEDSYSSREPSDEGGPTKTFLEHLEDLRWVLMKCAASIAVGFLLCLLGAPALVRILTRPLEQASALGQQKTPSVSFFMGTNRLSTFNLTTNQAALFGTNVHTVLELAPIVVGTNTFLGLRPVTDETTLAKETKVNLINLGPASAFLLAVQMAVYGGIALGSPFLFYFIGTFIFPALRMTEKKYTYWGLGFGLSLFIMGACFCYFILMPVALRASWQYSEWMGFKATEWRAEEYISFVCKFILGMGLGFELPVVLLVLVKIGILSYSSLAKMRRYMIVINLVLGAVLTTPEVVTQVMMAIPLQILYEVSVWIAWYWERRDKKRAAKLDQQ
ncbi:MAG: Sec-independent protein translocase protein TatC [Verrucomicrobiales bacterium]|nr:Sec-independent protein translocase protein TatC [Verrucomicrobiales bacterium]